MKWHVLESWLLLFYFDCTMRLRGFRLVHETVRRYEVRPAAGQRSSSADLCRAVDLACILYFKQVLCLQCSAATNLLLRRHGWNAEMVIGAQMLPFKSHAWVELNGEVVNDKPYMLDIYKVLERC